MRVLAVSIALAGTGAAAYAQPDSFHLMQIEQVIGGVGGDATRQAIQLRMRGGLQNHLEFSRLRAWDAAGATPVVLIDFTAGVPVGNLGSRVLIATSGFSTAPAAVPDFTLATPIPSSYLAAGRLTFEDDTGTILWSLAWGGAAYTGSHTGSLTNSPTGNFGPAFAGPLPSSGLQALLFQGTASAAAGANATDYALTPAAAVFTNNAGAAFTVVAAPAPCYANCDGSTTAPVLNVNDFICFQTKYAAGDSYANCDNSTTAPVLNVNDFICFQQKFAAGCP
jgi:hypothetical protein